MTGTRIQLVNVTKKYGQLTAADAVSMTIQPGELWALLGASGCGKTTTLRLIAGLERPDGGNITLGERQVANKTSFIPPEQRRVGLVFQDYALFPHLNVEQNIHFGLNDYRGDKKARMREMLTLVGLNGLERRMPHELSGGQQQRVALARALAPAPEVLLLDEPFSNLDAALRAQVRGEVRDILHKAEVTAVFVTHDQEEALSLADQVAVMAHGRVEQIGTPQQIYTQPQARHVAAFVGEANFISGHADGLTAHSALGTLTLTEAAQGAVDLMLRPEAVAIHAVTVDDTVQATVEDVEFYGHDQRVVLRLDDDTVLISRMGAWETFTRGQRVGVAVIHTAQAFDAK